jgi:hypothetical protein
MRRDKGGREYYQLAEQKRPEQEEGTPSCRPLCCVAATATTVTWGRHAPARRVEAAVSEDDKAHRLFTDGQAGFHLKRLHLHYRDRVLPRHRHVAELPVGAKGDIRAVLPNL